MPAPITTSANDPYENLIAQTIQIERQPQLEIQDKRGEEKRFRAVLDDLDSELSALHGELEGLADPVFSPFEGRTARVGSAGEEGGSAPAGFSVTAKDRADLGSHTMSVERLASADGRLSKRYDAGGTALRDFFDANGAQTFSVGVAAPTEDAPDARSEVEVTVDPEGATDGAILEEIDTAISQAMDAAVSADALESTERAGASVVRETTASARLSLRSGTTGYAGRLTFGDSGGGLLAELGVTSDAVASGAGGGQVTAVGASETDSQLNSKFTLDGLTLYRGTNRVSDALDGLTLNLEEAGGPRKSFEVTSDAESIKKEVGAFLEKYNSTLGFIERKAKINGETGERGDFAGEQAFTRLRFAMRSDLAAEVGGQPEGAPSRLSDLGIEIGDDGTLALDDEEALVAAVENDPAAVQQFFGGDDGLATRLTERVERFTRTGGVIDERQDSIDQRIDRLDGRIERFDDRLARREEQLRAQYAQVQETIQALQGQQQTFSQYAF